MEADGAKRLPLKAHAPHEPVIPPNTRQTIYVVGADGFGRPIRQICHRPERYAALCGAAEDDVVTPALEAAVLRAEGYAGGWVYVNKVETPQDWRNAEALAALLPGKVVAGSLWERRYRTISEGGPRVARRTISDAPSTAGHIGPALRRSIDRQL